MGERPIHPPRLPDRLLQWFCSNEVLETLQGDLYELYEKRREQKGKLRADVMYWVDVASACRPFAFRRKRLRSNSNILVMYNNYFKIAWRGLVRKKAYSLVNILSLAVGMAAALAISQYVYFELSYDRFHNSYEDIYRVIVKQSNTESDKSTPSTGWALGEAAKNEIPEIRQFVRRQRFNRGAIVSNADNGNVFHEDVNDLFFVEKSFFDVFNFPVSRGNTAVVFDDKFNVVITEETAKRYFGNENPLGKKLLINGPPSPGTYTITGVVQNPPVNSHFQFEFLMPIENYIEDGWGGAVTKQGGWNGFSVETYFAIDHSADQATVCKKLQEMMARHSDEHLKGKGGVDQVILQPIADIYLRSDIYSDPGFIDATGNVANLKVFSAIAFFILFISWINFINLSTARSAQRSKEVGIKKSIGAHKSQLVQQFLAESLVLNILAASLATLFAVALLPLLGELVGKKIDFSLLRIPAFWAIMVGTVLLGSLLSGLYPAFVLSSLKPFNTMRGDGGKRGIGVGVRRGLIVFQFMVSLLLVSGTYLVYRQTTFMKQQDTGIDLDKILVLRSQQGGVDSDSIQAHFEAFCDQLKAHHSVSRVTSSTCTPGQFGVTPYRRASMPDSSIPYSRSIFASYDFAETYGLHFLAGVTFQPHMNDGEVVIINEAAVRAFGFESAEAALHNKLSIGNKQPEIVGIVENFGWHSVKESHTPYVISLTSVRMTPYVSIKMNISNIPESLEHIQAAFSSFYINQPFDYYFADDAFNKQYQSETQFGKVLSSFSGLAVFIACIGLFALVSYSVSLKDKEIGIRKVLGASVGHLMILLTREYLTLLGVAVAIALPVVIYFGNSWLENYATRIGLNADLIVVPTLILGIVAIFTVGRQTYVAAIANPINSLRKE